MHSWLSFGQVNFKMSIRLPTGEVAQTVRRMSLEFKRVVWQNLNLGILGIKMVLMKVEEITRMSIENEEDKRPLS